MGLREFLGGSNLEETMSRIEEILISSNASDIHKKYDNGRVVSLSFTLKINEKPISIQLPVDIKAVEDSLRKDSQHIKPRSDEEKKLIDKSEIIAWKGALDWLNAQYILIKLGQATPIQIFLPYVYDRVNGKTFFKLLEEKNFQQLPQGNV